jgi:NADH-quinone oxidoreductase subunit N
MTLIDLYSILPVLVLVIWALVTLLVEAWTYKRTPFLTPVLAVIGLVAALVLTLVQSRQYSSTFNEMIRVDGFGIFLNVLFCVSGILSIGIAYDYLKKAGIQQGEYYPLIMLSTGGMMLMATAGDLVIVFLALELLSIPLYIMAGMAHNRVESKEAALKYFLLGTFASAVVLFGIALVYGATQTTNLYGVMRVVDAGEANRLMLVIGSAMLVGGFGFKVSAVPFHSWTPDVYEGAPSTVSAFMSVGAKAAGFAALIRVFSLDFSSLSNEFTPVFWVLAVLTMLVGNIVAVAQTNLKRMLAYSSIAHAGYILMAFVSFGNEAVRLNSTASALFYLAAYAMASLGAWAVLEAVEKKDGSGTAINDLAGLGKSSPVMAAAMSVFMLSFTGLPLTLGFWGKFYLFRTAIEGGYIWLAVIGLLTSLVSAFYYLRVIIKMYFQEGGAVATRGRLTVVVAVVTALILIVVAVVPGWLFNLATAGLIAGS